ncbi:TRAP transporter small permease [Marinigracilibium pacificum]|uniref:TRAP transporter small permease n=1 Tax=Marinigracilibium pacificum TaxID=2729599 RepID=A0A848J598_9BACT|nr:TRAP transporter small permease [Marinigracilibium pacificum]NMM49690.1 TRAP transporter small permease [Marinigracilibium pacificum]
MKNKVDKLLSGFLIGMLAVMLLAVLWQVFSRYILNSPSSVTEELSRYCLIWIGVLGAAYAAGQKMHLAITLFPDSLEKPNRDKLQVVINLLIIVFSITVFVIGGTRLVYITSILGQNSPALGIPLAWVYMVLPLSGLLVIYYKLIEILELRGGKHVS